MDSLTQIRSRNEWKLKPLYNIKGKHVWEKKKSGGNVRSTSEKKRKPNREVFVQDEVAGNVKLSYDTAPFNFIKLTIEKLESHKLHYLKNYRIRILVK